MCLWAIVYVLWIKLYKASCQSNWFSEESRIKSTHMILLQKIAAINTINLKINS